MDFNVTLLTSTFATHDVKRFIVSRPDDFDFEPGQGVELAINSENWEKKGRPFTPTSLKDDQVLEFIIKEYPEHDGVTEKLHQLEAGTKLLMSKPFGTIQYNGPGVFIAGGAGITPFIAIFRDLSLKNELKHQKIIFSNKTPADIISEKELRHYFDDDLTLTCTQVEIPGYARSRIDKDFIKKHVQKFDQPFYLCGPPGFMKSIKSALQDLGVEPDVLVFEE